MCVLRWSLSTAFAGPLSPQAWARKFGATRILHEIECNERQGTDSELPARPAAQLG